MRSADNEAIMSSELSGYSMDRWAIVPWAPESSLRRALITLLLLLYS
jgi:hypothetical protein